MKIQDMFLRGMKREIPELRQSSVIVGHVLNLGAGFSPIEGAINLDRPKWIAERDMLRDYAPNTISTIHAYHILEHLDGVTIIELLKDCQRVLVNGGVMNIVCPYYNSFIQAQDITHKTQFNEATWKTLFDNQYYNPTEHKWAFKVGVNIIIGIVERNLCLMTQLIKEDE